MTLFKRLLASLVVFILFVGLSFTLRTVSIDMNSFWVEKSVEVLPENTICAGVGQIEYKAGFPLTFVDNHGPEVCGSTWRYNPVAFGIDFLLVVSVVSLLFFLLSKRHKKF